jgi:mono/diheme cytochrome c family protein
MRTGMSNWASNIKARHMVYALAALIGLGAIVVGCHSARRGEPIVGPLSSNDPAVQHGKIVFAKRCNSCHPGGEGGLGPGLNDKPLPVFAMKLQVRTGLVGLKIMPSFDKHQIPSEDLDDLMKYIKAQRKHHQPMEQAAFHQ